jgi:tape measure domain-containing protein
MAAARTITPVNIRLGVDVTKIKEGMQVTSTELRNLSRLTGQSAEGMTKLGYATDLFNKFVAAGQVSRAEADRILESLAKKYGVVTEAAKKAAEATHKQSEEQKNAEASLRATQQILTKLTTDEEKFVAAQKLLEEQFKKGNIVGISLGEALRRLRQEYDQLTPAERAAANASKEAALRMKEYERLINLTKNDTEAFDRKLSGLNKQLHLNEITVSQYKAAVAALRNEYGILTRKQQEAIDSERRLAEAQAQEKRNIDMVKAAVERSIPIKEQYAAKVRIVVDLLKNQKIAADEAKKAIKQLGDEEKQEEARKNAKGSGIFGTLISPRALATGAAFAAVATSIASVKKMLSLTMQTEEIEAATKALTRSEIAASNLMATYRILDKESMLSMRNFAEAGKQMLAVGFAQNEMAPMLQGLGKISAGNEERFHSLVRALTQVQTAGKLTASELLQFVNAGWSPLNEIAKRAGETMAQTKKRIEEGGVSVHEVQLALISATTGVGDFANMNEEMAKTFSGSWSKVKSDMEAGAIAIGKSLVPALQELTREANAAGATLQIMAIPLVGLVNLFALLKAGITGGDEGLDRFLDKLDEADRDLRFQEELRKRQKDEEDAIADTLAKRVALSREVKVEEDKTAAFKKEIAKIEEQTFETIEKKWFKTKFGDEAEVKMLQHKISLNGELQVLTSQEQEKLNKKRLIEISTMEAAKEQQDKQEKLMTAMRQELAATEDLIRLRKGGLVVSEEDLKKHEKMKEFGNSAAKAEYERMYNRKIALDTEEKRLKEIQADAKKNQEKFQRPEVSFQENVAKLMSQRKLAGLTPDAFEGAGMDLAKSFLQAMNPQNVSASAAPTLRAGSVEAYKFIQEQNERRAQRAEQKALFDRMVKALEQQLEQNKNAPRLAMAGRG